MSGRRRNDTEIPEARETCRERPRYRRGAHPKRMDPRGQLRKLRLLCCAKMLLLVDDNQTKVGELHVLRGESLRSDHNLQPAAL